MACESSPILTLLFEIPHDLPPNCISPLISNYFLTHIFNSQVRAKGTLHSFSHVHLFSECTSEMPTSALPVSDSHPPSRPASPESLPGSPQTEGPPLLSKSHRPFCNLLDVSLCALSFSSSPRTPVLVFSPVQRVIHLLMFSRYLLCAGFYRRSRDRTGKTSSWPGGAYNLAGK